MIFDDKFFAFVKKKCFDLGISRRCECWDFKQTCKKDHIRLDLVLRRFLCYDEVKENN